MKSFLIVLLFCGALFMFSSCKKNSNPVSPTNSQQIWPLKIGNTWTYHVVIYDSSGIVTAGTASFSITSDTVVGGETWYHISNDTAGVFYTIRSDGFWTMADGLQALEFKYPGNSGDNWNFYGYTVSILTTDTLISTTLKKYSCYEYRISYNSVPLEDSYISPGVGLVAEDYYSSTKSGRLYIEHSAVLNSINLK